MGIALPRRAGEFGFEWLRLTALATLLGLLLLFALVVAVRRLSGALTQPLELGAVAVLVAVLASGAFVARRLAEPHRHQHPAAWPRRACEVLIPAVFVLLAAVVTLPGMSVAAAALLWGGLAAEETWSLWRRCRSPFSAAGMRNLPAVAERNDRLIVAPGEALTQQFLRTRTEDGAETIRGQLCAHFDAGQRTATAHLAFCPPLATVPELTLELSAGPEARIKVAQLLPYGARLDFKLLEPAEEPAEVVIDFTTTCRIADDGSK
jgi:hypothetical protein